MGHVKRKSGKWRMNLKELGRVLSLEIFPSRCIHVKVSEPPCSIKDPRKSVRVSYPESDVTFKELKRLWVLVGNEPHVYVPLRAHGIIVQFITDRITETGEWGAWDFVGHKE